MSETPESGGWHQEPAPARPDPAVPPIAEAMPLPAAAPRRGLLRTLWAGSRVALLGRPSLEGVPLGPGMFWLVLAANLLLSSLWAWMASERPREFSLWGLQQEGFYALVLLLVCHLLARAARRPELLWPIATLLTVAWIVQEAVQSLLYDWLLPAWGHQDDGWYWLVYCSFQLWSFAVLWRLLALLQGLRSGKARAVAALLATAAFALVSHILPYTPMWDKDYSAEAESRPRVLPLVAEDVFPRQPALLDEALAGIAPSSPGHPNLYFVAYAPDGDQDVFLKEARYSTELFRNRFGAVRRTLTLVNNRQTVDELPLASVSNLDRSLRAIGRKMNPQQDILFLYLTSHGSREAELATELRGLSFEHFTAPRLAQMLKDSGIRWKVVVVSACYSGSFLNSLKDDHTLVMTAARADRTSFGCSDDAEFTYFGRAFLQQALNQTTSFTEAFGLARTLVDNWETRDNEIHSEPQIANGALIGAKLEQWRATLGSVAPRAEVPRLGRAQ